MRKIKTYYFLFYAIVTASCVHTPPEEEMGDPVLVLEREVRSILVDLLTKELVKDTCIEVYPDTRARVTASFDDWKERNDLVIQSSEKLFGLQPKAAYARLELENRILDHFPRFGVIFLEDRCQVSMDNWNDESLDYENRHPKKYELITQATRANYTAWPPHLSFFSYADHNDLDIILASNARIASMPNSQLFKEGYKLTNLGGFAIITSKESDISKLIDYAKKNHEILSRVWPISHGTYRSNIHFSNVQVEILLKTVSVGCPVPIAFAPNKVPRRRVNVTMYIKNSTTDRFCESMA